MGGTTRPGWYARLGLLAAAFGILLGAYLPVATADFKVHDDYWLERFEPAADCRDTREYIALVGIGRPLSAETTRCVLRPLYESGTIRPDWFWPAARLVSVLAIGVAAAIATALMLELGLAPIVALWAGVAMFLAPGFGVFVSTGISVTQTVAAPLVPLALYMLASAMGARAAAAIFVGAGAFLLLLGSLFFYQVYVIGGFAFVVGALFLAPPGPRTRRFCLVALVLMLAAMAAYFLLHKFVVKDAIIAAVRHASPLAADSRQVEIASPARFVENFRALYGVIYHRAVDLWLLDLESHVARRHYILALGALIGLAGLVTLLRQGRATRWWTEPGTRRAGLGQLALLGLAAAGLGSFFIVYGPGPWNRVLSGLVTAFQFLLGWSAIAVLSLVLPRRLAAAAVSLALLAAGTAFAQLNTVRYYAQTATAELAFLRGALQPWLDGSFAAVKFFPPTGNTLVPGDEYSILTTSRGTEYGLRGMTERILAERGLPAGRLDLTREADGGYDIAWTGAPAVPPEQQLPIWGDAMRGLANIGIVAVATSSQGPVPLSLAHFGRGHLGPPWHAEVPPRFPVTLELTYWRKRPLREVAVVAQRYGRAVFVERMPRTIELRWRVGEAGLEGSAALSTGCRVGPDGAAIMTLPAGVEADRVRLVIRDNCGDPELLTFEAVELH